MKQNKPMSRAPTRSALCRARQQRGTTLVVVFLVVALMAGMAMAVLLTARTDMRVAGHDRENAISFFAAEAGLAYGKDWLKSQYDTTTYWTPVLNNTQATQTGFTVSYDAGGKAGMPLQRARYTYRFRNNTNDPSASPTVDSDGRIVVVSVGEALDPSGTRVVAVTTLELEVDWAPSTNVAAGAYGAQSNQSAAGAAAGHVDLGAVNTGAGASF